MFNSDLPIKSKKQDILERAKFAESLSKAILDYQDEESLTLGLYGSWGSGKTSIINMAIEKINEGDGKDKPNILKFNPWNYSDQNQLIAQFFRELARVLPLKDRSKGIENAVKLLDSYAAAITPLIVIPNPSSPAALGQAAICKAFSNVLNRFKSKNKSLQETKDELNTIFKKQSRKTVIVIDDIDRLNNTEIRQVFQLVKSLADFKNTIYILVFDKNVVIRALSKVQEGDGYEYLEKVVQVPFAIPAVPILEVHKFLFASLDSIIKDLPKERFDQTYWVGIFHSGIRIFFKTIRDVNRFINIFRFKYFLLKDDVNVIDLIAITAIQVFLPDLHSKIKDNKAIFLEGYKDTGYGIDKRQELKEILDEIIKHNTREFPVDIVTELLNELFPKLSSLYRNITYGDGFEAGWRRNGRACSEDNFDMFFQLNMPSGKISKSEIEGIISNSENQEQLHNVMEQLKEEGRISEFLERLLDYSEKVPLNKIQNIINVLLNQGDGFPKDNKEMLGFDNISRIGRVGYFFTKDLGDKDKCFNIYKNAIVAAEDSIYTLVDAIVWLGWDHGKGTIQEPKPEEEQRIDEKQLTELKKLACQKIDIWAKDGRLLKHPELIRILRIWESWTDKKVIEEYVQKFIESESGLIDFIGKFPSEVRSQGMGEYGYRTEYQVHLDSIKHFIDLDVIVQRLRGILSCDIFQNLPEEQKRAVKLVLDTYDGKIKPKF